MRVSPLCLHYRFSAPTGFSVVPLLPGIRSLGRFLEPMGHRFPKIPHPKYRTNAQANRHIGGNALPADNIPIRKKRYIYETTETSATKWPWEMAQTHGSRMNL